jgi:hypothetical protein
MREYLSQELVVDLVQAALADGATDPDSTAVDMAGYDGVMFIGICGTITGSGTCTLAASQSSDNAVADDFSAISGASAVATSSTKSDKILVVDVLYPAKRYVRTTLTRAVANSVWGGTLALRYCAKNKPTTFTAAALAAAIAQVCAAAEA